MAKTWLSAYTALALVSVSTAVFVLRRHALGAETDGPPGWEVTLTVEGEMPGSHGTLITMRPPDFRQQHIAGEKFHSQDLRYRFTRIQKSGQRKVVWRQAGLGKPGRPFRAVYSFRWTRARPTLAMARLTERIDAAPEGDAALEPLPRIEKDLEQPLRETLKTVPPAGPPLNQARALFDALARLPAGDPRNQSRLFVALCRARHLPARLVCGLIVRAPGEQPLHWWAEVWLNDRWLPASPAEGMFGADQFPENHLVLDFGDRDPVRGWGLRTYQFRATSLHDPTGSTGDSPPSAAKAFFRKASLYWLRPGEQHVVKFLLLLPLAALIVCLFRVVIGVPTFGTFGPALVGLAFRDLNSLPWGLLFFLLTVMVGWGIRRILDHFHLLHVPRVSAMMTLIVVFLIVLIGWASSAGVTTTQYVALFPLVILTHLVERFWMVETEDGTAASFWTLLGTSVVAVAVSLALSADAVAQWMFRYPESLGVVLAAQLLLGRYTGYRVSELYRFRDFLEDQTVPGGRP